MDDVFFPIGGGNEIGASSYFLRIGADKILLDAGIRLNSDLLFPNFIDLYSQGYIDGLWDLSAIFLSHGHIDHIGALPQVVNEARNIPIYTTPQTKTITTEMLLDTLREKDKNSTSKSEFDLNLQLFNRILIENAINALIEKNWRDTIELPCLKITFFPAGHILGASMIYIEAENYTILYTGDFSDFDQYTVRPYQLPDDLKVDILITETTYGYQNLSYPSEICSEKKNFIAMINTILERQGNILIPALAVGRSQELSLLLSDSYQSLLNSPAIYVDGLSKKFCEIYETFDMKIFDQDVNRATPSLIQNIQSMNNSIIISSSGMLLDNSKSAKYAEKLLPNPNNALFFTGYLDEESPGKRLSKLKHSNGQFFEINKKKILVNAQVDSYRLSAHTNHKGILNLIRKLQPKKVIFVHGFPKYDSAVNIFTSTYQEFGDGIELYQAMNGIPIFLT